MNTAIDYSQIEEQFCNFDAMNFAKFICKKLHITGISRNLVVGIAKHMNLDSHRCWASNRTLANELQVCVRTIKKHKKLIRDVVDIQGRTTEWGATMTDLCTFKPDIEKHFQEYCKFRARQAKSSQNPSKHRGAPRSPGGAPRSPNKRINKDSSSTGPVISVDKLKFKKFSKQNQAIPVIDRHQEFKKFQKWYEGQQLPMVIWQLRWDNWNERYVEFVS